MNKKFLIITFITFLVILNFTKALAFENEDSIDDTYEISELLTTLEVNTTPSSEPETNSSHIIAIDRASKRILFEKDAYTKTAMASTTKILTAIITIENCNLNENVLISQKAASTSGSTLGIYAGTSMSVNDLLLGLMLKSGNDCAVALAEHISGTVENFSNIMNEKANSLKMINSHFVTPHGLDSPDHYTTAYELAILTDYALSNETFCKIVGTKSANVNCGKISKVISNTNELLGNFNGVYGVKTGFTFNAGRCLVSACNQNNLDIIVVVLGADSKKIRTIDSIKTLNYVFNNFKTTDIQDIILDTFDNFKNTCNAQILAKKSVQNLDLELSNISNISLPLKTQEISDLETEIYTLKTLKAPLPSKFKIGTINIKINNKIVSTSDIILKNSISKKSWKYYYKEILGNFFKF